MTDTYTLVDLFAGCGGMTCGFVDSDRFKSVLAVEADADAAATYAENFGAHVHADRIERIRSFPQVDVVVGGPPCQAFSTLNRRRLDDGRRGLLHEYARVLAHCEPRAFVIENVPGLLASSEFAAFRAVAEQRLGFRVETRVLDAADYGVPQRRRRAIVIGSRVGDPHWPRPTHADPLDTSRTVPAWRTFRDAVAGLPLRPDGRNWHVDRNPTPVSRRRYRAVPRDGGDRFAMQRNLERAGLVQLVPRCWRDKPTGTTDVFGRLWWDKPAVTIRTEFQKPEKGRYLHPSAHRAITVREAARCMSFRDDFVLPQRQTMTSIARQVGNAVPPLLAGAVAAAVATLLDADNAWAKTRKSGGGVTRNHPNPSRDTPTPATAY